MTWEQLRVAILLHVDDFEDHYDFNLEIADTNEWTAECTDCGFIITCNASTKIEG